MEFIEQGPVKFSILISRSLYLYLLEIQIFLYMGKEPRKEIVLVDYLFQQQISTSMLEINTSVYMYKKSVSLINSPQGPDDQNRELYGTLFSKLHGKKSKQKPPHIC